LRAPAALLRGATLTRVPSANGVVKPGQNLALRILLQPNAARGGAAEWRTGELVAFALSEYGVEFTYDSASSALRTILMRKGLVQPRKAGKGVTLHSLTEKARGPWQPRFARTRACPKCRG
jgi:hypothetical protein